MSRSAGYSRWTDHSVHLCFRTPRARFPRTRLLSHVPVVTGPLPVAHAAGWAGDLRFGASPCRGIAPSRLAWVLALLQRYSPRSLLHDRPHVSISEALPSAFASCGIPPGTPCGWHLLMSQHESPCRVTPFPVPMVCIRRAVLSTGFLGSADRSVSKAAGAISCAFWLQRISLLRWFAFTMAYHTFACAAHRCVLDGIPGLRLPGSAVYPRFKPLRTSRGPGGYAVTPAPGGRDLHPHDKLSYEVKEFLFTSRSTRKPWLPFDQRVAPPQTPY
jgi:hypothetical protein